MNRKKFILGTATVLAGTYLSSCITVKYALKNLVSNEEIIIIGSGYGGAVAALRLAQAGYNVTILEMGLDWSKYEYAFSDMIWSTKYSTWLRTTSVAPFGNYRSLEVFTGVLDRMDFEHVKIYAGRGVGGGSLVNGGMAVTPKLDYFKEIFPNIDADSFYKKYFPIASKELGVQLMPNDFHQSSSYYRFSRVGEQEAHNAGFKTFRVPNIYDYGYMEKEEAGKVKRSAFAGEVIYGNNAGKKDLTKTYLKKALATGRVVIQDLTRVEFLEQKNNKYYIYASGLNTKGDIIKRKKIKADKVICAAGSVGTTTLLLKSMAHGYLPTENKLVGKFWGNNGNCMAGRNFVNTAFNPVSGLGSEAGKGTGHKQSTIPASGVDNWDDPEHCFFTEIAPIPMGMEVNTALYLSINKVDKCGSINYNKNMDKTSIDWDKSHTQNMVENAKFFVDKMIKANGGTYANLLFDRGIGADICYHPLGGAVIGKATDNYGRLRGYEHLYVLDGALIPASIGVNPFMTITALAEYCIEEIIKNDCSKNDNS